MKENLNLVFAVCGSRFYQQMLTYCLDSMRYYEPQIPAKIYVFGKVHRPLRQFLKKDPRSTLIQSPELAPDFGPAIKWIALSKNNDERVLFVDADLVFLNSPLAWTQNLQSADLYTDPERGCESDFYRGSEHIPLRMDLPAFAQLHSQYRTEMTPVPFTGLMLFNRSAHVKLLRELPFFLELYSGFLKGHIPYPCTIPWMADEVAASLLFGRFSKLKKECFPKSVISHFNDWTAEPEDLGQLLHLGNNLCAPAYDFFGLRAQSRLIAKLRTERFR